MKYLRTYESNEIVLNEKDYIILYLYNSYDGGRKTIRKQTQFDKMDEAIDALFGSETYFVDIDPKYDEKMEDLLEMVEKKNRELFKKKHTYIYGVDCEIVRQKLKVTDYPVDSDEINMLVQTKKYNL